MIPTPVQPTSRVVDLKNRLDWGEPALTIIDVRSRDAFNDVHIMGAISLPIASLVSRAQASLELTRDIYVYGETDEETTAAANALREAGFTSVSELQGGLSAWKAARYEIEGIPTV
jgi:rhodanese-related sulfurtransferase